jgi:hypothetical protein
VRKRTAFVEYVQCMFDDLETCIHVHDWLATNDFNYSDGFMNRLWPKGGIVPTIQEHCRK